MSTPLSPDDVFDLRFVRDARVAPAGDRVICAVSATDRDRLTDSCALWMIDLGSGEHEVLTGGDEFAMTPRWSPDGRHVAYVDTRAAALMVRPADGGPARRLSEDGRVVSGPPDWSPDGRRLVVAAGAPARSAAEPVRTTRRIFRADGVGFIGTAPLGLDVVDVAERRTESLVAPTDAFHCSAPRWSPAGDRILFQASFDATSYHPRLRTVDVESGAVRDVLGSWGGCQVAAWLEDGERIAFVGVPAGPRVNLHMNLYVVGADGVPQCRTPDFPAHVTCRVVHDMPVWDVAPTGLTVTADDAAYVTVQQGGSAGIWRIALTGAPDRERVLDGERTCLLLDHHPAAGLLFAGTDVASPTELYLADGEHERRLTRLNDDVLASWPRLRTEHLAFSAPDGLELEGWFVTRADAEGAQPAVLNVHQGPYMCVGHAFRFDLHLLASHGIAVLYSNFRGSAGYGQEFMDAIGHDWGTAAFPDHMAAVDAAVASGLADPDRLGVWGASHGGFATCWIVGHTDRFAAAVAEAAVTDFAISYYTNDIPDFVETQFGGRPDQVPQLYHSRSPVTYAVGCTTPILMLHYANDLRCPVNQAEAFHRAVLDGGGTSELVIMPGGSHIADSTGEPPLRLAQNEALLDWFARNLLPVPAHS
jgi:dipeptidyl aminopeptidase/acylaminoacyl peptidase